MNPHQADSVFWRRDATFPRLEPGVPPDSVDLVVVGAGYTGLSAALEYARRGGSVLVVEAGGVGTGASAMNGGFVHAGLKRGIGQLERHYGELGRALYHETRLAVETVAELIDEFNIRCDFRARGYLYLADRRRSTERLQRQQHQLEHLADVDARMLSKDQLEEAVGSSRYESGLLVSGVAAEVQPAKLLAGLAFAAIDKRCQILEHTTALRLQVGRDGVRVLTTRGPVVAKQAILATDGYTGELYPWLRRRIIPIESYILVTEQLEPAVADGILDARHLCVESKNFLCFWRKLPDRRLLFGGRASFAPTDVVDAERVLRRRLVETYPRLAGVRIETAWGGRVGFTFDQLPHIARQGPIVSVAGYCGGGIALATHLGRQTAALLDRGPMPAFAQLPFRGNPLYRRRPWFLRPAGVVLGLADRRG